MRRKVLYNPGSSFYPYTLSRSRDLESRYEAFFFTPSRSPWLLPTLAPWLASFQSPIAHRGKNEGGGGFFGRAPAKRVSPEGSPRFGTHQPTRACRWGGTVEEAPAGSPFESDGAGLARRTLGEGRDATARRVRVLTGGEGGAGRPAFALPVEMPICGVPGTCDIARG